MKMTSHYRCLHTCCQAFSLTLFSFLTVLISGCIMSNGPVSDTNSHNANQMVMIGVPILLGGFGSAVPISKDYMITAKHVAQLSWDLNVIHHPYCDLSLIRRSSDNVPTWGLIYPNQPVSHHGHSLVGNSIKGDGKYLQDVIDTNTDCLYSLSDAPVMSGMSGGPVFNSNGEIAGITVAIVHNPEDLENLRPARRYSQFVPATLIFDWLDALGIEAPSASTELASIQVSEYVASLNRPGNIAPRIATTRPATKEIKETSTDQLTPVASEQASTINTAPFPRHHTPVVSTFQPPSKRIAPDSNTAEALSGLRNEQEEGSKLTLKQEKKNPPPK
ncbi:serine protease [uncultured Photobacterium sp.]|uniref:serine protease n=1 Tax=uncultured Photobacterium sp. TaxID=173973 RepID=UPI00260FF0D7|nr:serine protease [uncultured Photobacterium sp.]